MDDYGTTDVNGNIELNRSMNKSDIVPTTIHEMTHG